MIEVDKNNFNAALISRHGKDVHEKLSSTTAAICGLGGLGSNVAVALARINVGKLILIDFDKVDTSNLNRQQYFIDQVGMSKPRALKENLEKINPFIEYVCHEVKITPDNITPLVGDADIITECFDLADQKQMLVESVLTKMPSKTIVSASGMAGFGKSNTIKTQKINERLFIVGDCRTGASAEKSLMAPRVAIAAAHQANAVAEYIINGCINVQEQ